MSGMLNPSRAHDSASGVDRAVAFLRERAGERPRVGLILGSGLGGLADALEARRAIPFAEVPGFPRAGVDGHHGRVIFGRLDNLPCVVLAGRVHLYEGHTPDQVVLPTRALVRLGIDALIVTSAAGGIDPTFRAGDLMIIADHINLLWRSPLVGPALDGETRWPDLSTPYDPQLRQLAVQVAVDEHIRVVNGVYCAVTGPSYETPAEIRMLARLGAHAVGMSTVPETLVARAAGVPVLGMSLITNQAAGLGAERLNHDDVLAIAADSALEFERLVRGVLARRFG